MTLVADSAASSARSTTGALSLRTQPEELQTLGSASTPLAGSTDIDIDAVGAHRVGDLASDNPEAPGVLVIESDESSGRSILLRFGSEANRRDLVRFDGAYTVLAVHDLTSDGFAGRWRSGVRGPRTEGYFCAVGPEG